ncbi:MAG: YggS family pyridoxal phosphate-dependent enzyme [Gemmatimonadales bacterium]|nr:YggS family pyridoxal phosphate-dependent enzyme [Gemmatimonadales bacterium]
MTGSRVQENLERVRERIDTACARAGRTPRSVKLVAVSKRIPLPLLVDVCQAGQWDLGENRVQDALDRQAELSVALTEAGLPTDRVVWHFIGHLQGNKVGRVGGNFDLLHGVDSVKLAQRLSRTAEEGNRTERILLEVNISREKQKHGFTPEEVVEAAANIGALPGLELGGLMGMGRFGATETELRKTFASLRELAGAARKFSGLSLPELSMGMSGDFEEAIAEGSTLIRVGGAIFGERSV